MTKSDMIREAISRRPDATASEIAKMLNKDHGVTVSKALVYALRSRVIDPIEAATRQNPIAQDETSVYVFQLIRLRKLLGLDRSKKILDAVLGEES